MFIDFSNQVDGVEGVYFYWFSWMLWIIYTFFMKKDRVRILVAASLLILISLSVYEITIGSFHLTLSYIFILIVSYYFAALRRSWRLIYMFISSAIVMLSYVSFELLALFDPVWVFMNRVWMLAVILTFITIMLYRDYYSRLLTLIIGSCQGDFLYAVILNRFSFPHLIGSLAFLDMLIVTCSFLFGLFILENMSTYIDWMMQKQVKETKQS
jgi:hypothetical protein